MTFSPLAAQLNKIIDETAAALTHIDEAAASAADPETRKWSKKQILGHLIDSAANNHQRFVRAPQSTGEFSFPIYRQESWVELQNYQARSWAELIAFWKSYNQHLAHVIENIPAAKADTLCRIGESEPVSLKFLVEDYIAHLQHHITQITA